ncbi:MULTISPECIES: hypothetical protein [unclassified Okeania]|nr:MULTISPECIES: hypothetical protein [unclassified Okeania]
MSEGSYHQDLLETWLKDSFISQLESGDIIVIDHTSFHKKDVSQE